MPEDKKDFHKRLSRLIKQVYSVSVYLSGSKDTAEYLTKKAFNICIMEDLCINDRFLWKRFCTIALRNSCVIGTRSNGIGTIGNNLREELPDAILSLPPDERLVLLLREVVGLSYEEISHCINCSKEKVITALTRGRGCLANIIIST